MLYAARLLRRGTDLESVAALTDVPVPLLELLQSEDPPIPTCVAPRAGAVGPAHVSAQCMPNLFMKAVVVLAAANLVLGVIALVAGSTTLSTATGVLAVVLLGVVVAVVRRSRPPRL